MLESDISFYRGKRVLVTGHTGFKGSWLCRILLGAGARVYGYALAPQEPRLYSLAGLQDVVSFIGDVRDRAALAKAFGEARPEIVFHLAAQPIVLEGYRDPLYTFETNVLGTVNLLECVRSLGGVRSFVNVTTDKVYRDAETASDQAGFYGGEERASRFAKGGAGFCRIGYAEGDALGGADPYSCSKSCSDLIAQSYAAAFFADGSVRVSTVRSGNAIGGGDFAPNRILPDCIRAAVSGVPIRVRHPDSVRPYQHVLEPLSAYLMLAAKQWESAEYAGEYNVGPNECCSTGELAELFCKFWGKGQLWEAAPVDFAPREAPALRLDCSKIGRELGWEPRWGIEEGVRRTVEWAEEWLRGGNIPALMDRQIDEFLRGE